MVMCQRAHWGGEAVNQTYELLLLNTNPSAYGIRRDLVSDCRLRRLMSLPQMRLNMKQASDFWQSQPCLIRNSLDMCLGRVTLLVRTVCVLLHGLASLENHHRGSSCATQHSRSCEMSCVLVAHSNPPFEDEG